MLTHSIDFVENSEYAFGVARIRALETKFIDETAFNTLLSADPNRFLPQFTEITGIKGSGTGNISLLLDNLEESFSDTFRMIKAIIIEDEMKRLISLKYDYEILKIILKEGKGRDVRTSVYLLERSNYGYGALKAMLVGGRALDTGEILYRTYRRMIDLKEAGGREIDYACDSAYYQEVFQILDSCNNEFIRNYFVREIDAHNIATTLRLKIQGKPRSLLKQRFIPLGSIDLPYFEEGFDLNLESFASKILFSPLSSVLRAADKSGSEDEQVALVEKGLEDELTFYLRESVIVTFGIEPLFAYLYMKERELKNLRTICVARMSGVTAGEIRKYIRGFYG